MSHRSRSLCARLGRTRAFRFGLSASSTLLGLRAEAAQPAAPFRVGLPPAPGWLGDSGLASAELPVTVAPGRGELFFVDADVADPGAFWLAAPRGATVVSVPAGTDAWAFMAREAANYRSLRAIHLVSHGEPGALVLNRQRYGASELAAQAAALRQLGAALSKNGDLLVYGCDTAAGADGAQLVATLSDLTGADVAASVNPTGGQRDADWNLEIARGEIETALVAPADYAHTLATVTVTSNADSGAGSLRAAITDATAGDTITFNAGMTITLSTLAAAPSLLKIEKNLTIDGDLNNDGTADVTLDGDHNGRVLEIAAGSTVSIDGLVIQKGLLSGNGGDADASTASDGGSALGAGIYNSGTLQLKNVLVRANRAAAGGGAGGGAYGGGGGGGGAIAGRSGGSGGAFGAGSGVPGTTAGTGGDGAGPWPGAGGSATADGEGYGGMAGNGGFATNGSISIGGGGGAATVNGRAGNGGGAVGGVFNNTSATLTLIGGSVTGNLGAGGGGGANGLPGNAGRGVGGIWNKGSLRMTATAHSATTAGDSGNAGTSGEAGNQGASVEAQPNIFDEAGTLDPAYVANAAPLIANLGGDSVAFIEDGSAALLDLGGNATVADGDSANFVGGSVTVSIASPSTNEDLAISTAGSGVTLSSAMTAGSIVSVESTSIGTIAAGSTGQDGTSLVVSLNANATPARVTTLLRAITYTNASDAPAASRTVSFTVDDGDGGPSAAANVTVAITAANDAPSGSPVPTDLSFTEDVAGNFDLSSVTLSDPDAGAEAMTLTLTANAGTFSSLSGGGVTVMGSGSGTLTLMGALADLNTFLDTAANISYTGAANAHGDNAATVTVKLNDGGNTGTGGVLETPLGTVNVDITAVNDAPTLTGSPTASQTITEDASIEITAGAFAGFFSDPDSASLQIAITGSTGTGWQYDAGWGWQPLGSVSEAQALLLGTGSRFRYLPQAQNAETATLTVRAWDQTSGTASSGGTRGTANTSVNGGSTAFSTGTVTLTMTVIAVNDAPTATNLTQSIAYNEDPGSGVPIADIVVTEVDVGDVITATLTLSHPAAGSLSIDTYGSLTSSYNAGTGVWTATGSVVDVNNALSAVAFSPAANWAQPASITTRIRDAAGTGPADGTLTLAVTPVNDAPVATITPASYTATEQTALPLKGTGLSIADVDATGADVMTVTVSVTEGTLTATAGTSGATVSNSGTASVSITGTLAQVNALLATDGTSTLSYFNSSDAPSANTTLTLLVSDGGATGTGGTLTGTDTAAIALTAVNDSPTVAINTGASAETGGLVTITAAMLNEGDPDDSGAGLTYTVTTAPVNGTLFKDVDASNTVDSGEALAANGTFTQDDIDQGRIKYLHGGSAGASDTFVFNLADGGEDGSTPVTNRTFAISVAARPVVSPGGGAMPSYSEGLAAVAIDSALTVSDSDSASLEAAVITITDRVDGDTLNFTTQNGIMGSFNAATGELSLSGTATLAAYQTALRSITYASTNDNPATGAGNNTRVIRFTVADDDALASVPVDVTIAVENTNDAPTLNPGESPTLVDATEDAPAPSNGSTAGSTPVSALLAGAADVDTGALQGLALIGTTAQGTLWYSIDNGMTWTQAPAVAETNALLLQSDARLYLQPSANVNGSITDAITFKAWDRTAGSNGGTGDSTAGSAFSTASDTASVTIAAVADTPSAGSPTINEDTTATIVIARNPADGAETTHYKLTALTNGALFSDAGLTTPITNGAFFTSAGASTSVYFRPTLNFAGAAGFTVQASSAGNDAGLGGASAASVITVNAVNDAPTDITLSDALVAHNEGVGAVVGTLSATDVDDATFTFALVTGAGATDNARFAIDGANLKLAGTTLPPDGTYSIRIQADDGDTGGTFAKTFTIEVDDNVAPVAPSAPDLLAASDLGVSATDNLTADTTPTFTGTAEAGSTVTLYADGVEVGSATTATDGTWTITASTLTAGTYTFTATATDAGTNTSAASAGLAVTIDADAPEIDTITRQTPTTLNTDASSVTWRVTFTEPVTGVDPGDFAVTLLDRVATGTIVSATGVPGSETTDYDITVNVSGQGALRLDKVSGTGIADLAGNTVEADEVTDGQMYIVGVANVFDTLSLTHGGSVSATAAGASKLAQRFTTGATEPLTLTTVAAALGWTYDEPGAPVPVVTIHADNGDVPAAAVLATLDHPGALEPHALNVWTGNLRLTASTTYWVVFATTPASTGRFEINTTAATSGGQGTWLASPLAADYKYRYGANQAAGALRIAIGATSIPVITSSLTASGTAGTAFSYQIAATNTPTSFTATGLPPGLSVNTSTGLISGTPTQAGTFTVTLTGANAGGPGPASILVLTIAPEPPPSKQSQTITFTPLGDAVVGDVVTLSARASSGLPVSFSLVSGPATLSGSTVTCTGIGAVTVRATQSGNANYNAATAVVQSFTVGLPIPTVTTPTQVPAPAPGGTATLTVPTPIPSATYQWQRNGANLTNATNPTLTLPAVQPPSAGLYTYTVQTPGGASATSEPVIVGVATTEKVEGTGTQVGADIQHPNGNIYDQLLLEGAGATFTAEPAKITRMSYVDLSGDIVQVEFSGAGSLSLVMDDAGTPAPAANYNQPGVNYVRGHVGIVITGADETTNVSVFSVGRITAVNQALFREEVAYDGVANIAFIAIQSTNGRFGGVRTGNVEYYAQSGFTGLYAPGVAFAGPVNIGDIQAFDNAQPLLVVGSAPNAQITGGSLAQPNGQPVTVNGLTQLTMAPGQTSQGDALPAQTNQGVLEQDGIDVTDLLVAAP